MYVNEEQERIMYTNREQEWVRLNNVKEGTVVRVTRKAVDNEAGWDNSWTRGMDKYVGKEFPVGCMDEEVSNYVPDVGIPLVDEDDDIMFDYQFPYFVLEVV